MEARYLKSKIPKESNFDNQIVSKLLHNANANISQATEIFSIQEVHTK